MTNEELSKLTPEEKDILIFNACPDIAKGGYIQGDTPMVHIWGDHFQAFRPTRDLNAMHEAERTTVAKTSDLQFDYWQNIAAVLGINRDWGTNFDLLHATAAQRAEAFLLTVG